MIEKMKITAKTVEEAIKKAADIWKIDAVKNGYTVIQEPSRGIFGIGSKDAIIEVNKNVPDILFEEPKKEEQPAPVKETVKEEPTKITPAPSESVPTPQEEETQIIVEDLSAASVQETTLAQAAAEVQTLPEDASAEEVGLAFLGPIFKALQVEDAIVNVSEDAGTIRFDVTGEHVGILIGRRGETLDAIQQLTSYSVNRTGSRVRVQLDAENYRAKREQSLERLANKVAAKVVKYRRSVTLEPMNAYERHVIHTALQDVPGVTTYSTGVVPNRRVIVAFDRESK